MEQFSREQLMRARSANLYDFLTENHFDDFKIEGNSIRMRDNHSVSIGRGFTGYLDFATGDHGNSIDFLVRYMGYRLDEAVFALCDDYASEYAYVNREREHVNAQLKAIKADRSESKAQSLPLELPAPIEGRYRHTFANLMKRGISQETIQMLIDKRLLYQAAEKNNMIFVNADRDWAEVRGTYDIGEKAHHGIIKKDDRDGGYWAFESKEDPKVAYVCEGALDAISLYELHQLDQVGEPALYVSIGGATKQPAINRLKKEIKVILAVDNDDAGEACRQRNSELEYIIPEHKDWNEDLQDIVC